MTNAGKMPALHRAIGLKAVRESGSAGVPPAMTDAGKMPALHRRIGLKAVRESGSAGVPPANHEGSEKPCERGLRFAAGSTPRPGVKRRASRPPAAEKARQRASAFDVFPMVFLDRLRRPRREGPWAGLGKGIGPEPATARSPVNRPLHRPITHRGSRSRPKSRTCV